MNNVINLAEFKARKEKEEKDKIISMENWIIEKFGNSAADQKRRNLIKDMQVSQDELPENIISVDFSSNNNDFPDDIA